MQKETLEVLEMMVERMQIMEQELRALNEKQNNQGDKELQTGLPVEDGKQIPLTGLDSE